MLDDVNGLLLAKKLNILVFSIQPKNKHHLNLDVTTKNSSSLSYIQSSLHLNSNLEFTLMAITQSI